MNKNEILRLSDVKPNKSIKVVNVIRSLSSLIEQVRTNFEIGRLIVEHEQAGIARAAYGAETLMRLSASLTVEFGRGFSKTNLKLMRQFFLTWKDRHLLSFKRLPRNRPRAPIGQKASDQLMNPFSSVT